jgi:hypothetical protein
VNDVARSVVGCRREDHVTIVDLLEAAKYLLLNQQVVKATAMSAWSSDRPKTDFLVLAKNEYLARKSCRIFGR